MKSFLRSLTGSLAALCISASLLMAPISLAPAEAAVALVGSGGGVGSNALPQTRRLVAFGDVTASSTFATASYADLPGSTITFVPLVNDETTAGRNSGNFPGRVPAGIIEVEWSIDGTKATATTGTCAVFVNGAVVASSARTVGAVTEDVIGGTFYFTNTTAGSQPVKLQCKSGDTNVFTVNFGHMAITEIIPD